MNSVWPPPTHPTFLASPFLCVSPLPAARTQSSQALRQAVFTQPLTEPRTLQNDIHTYRSTYRCHLMLKRETITIHLSALTHIHARCSQVTAQRGCPGGQGRSLWIDLRVIVAGPSDARGAPSTALSYRDHRALQPLLSWMETHTQTHTHRAAHSISSQRRA